MTKLIEHVGWRKPQVSEEDGYVEDVKVLGLQSKNGRSYRRKAVEGALKLYEGAMVNLNHKQGNRDVVEAFGQLSGLYMKDDGAYARRFDFLKKHSFSPTFIEMCQRMPAQVGLSHVAEGEVSRENGEEFVESIDKVISVDLVRNPASVKGLFEAYDMEPMEAYSSSGMRGHLRAAIMSLLEDQSMPLEEVRKKIMAILRTEKRVAGESEEKPAEEQKVEEQKAEKQEARQISEEEKKAAEELKKLREHVDSLLGEIHSLRHSQSLTECIQSHGLDVANMTDEQVQTLRDKKTREEMDKFAESLPDSAKIGASRPHIPAGSAGGADYSSLRKELEEELQYS